MARYAYSFKGRKKRRILRWTYAAASVILIIVSYCTYLIFSGEKDTAPVVVAEQPPVETVPLEKAPEKAAPVMPAAPVPLAVSSAVEVKAKLPEVAPQPSLQTNSKASVLIKEALVCINSKPSRIIGARDRLNEALPLPLSADELKFVKELLYGLSDQWLFSRNVYPDDSLCENYQVKIGDKLSKIGQQFKVPHEILMEINGIKDARLLQAGQTIKVIKGPFHCRVYLSTLTMDLFLQNTFVRSFSVGIGKTGVETPTGLWQVKKGGKLITPTWNDPDTGKTYEAEDPDYPLGSRWIGLEGLEGNAKGRNGFAFHGTKERESIGIASSRGCIRLHNGDAILVYNLLTPVHSKVETVE